MEKYARVDSITGKGMNDGYCFNDGEAYCATEETAKKYVENLGLNWEEELLTIDTEDEWFYWTEWEIEDDAEYYDEKGNEYDSDGNLNNELFEYPEKLPAEIKEILDWYSNNECRYEDCKELIEKLNKVGYTCDYYLDGELHNFKKI